MIIYDEDQVREKLGLDPLQVVDMKALAGDPSDNIPGVPGIGGVSARKLVKEFGSLEGVLENLESVQPRWRDLIRSSIDSARLSKKLATIKTDLDLHFDLEKCLRTDPDLPQLRDFLTYLEFRTLLKKLAPSGEEPEAAIWSVDFTTIDSSDGWESAKATLEKSESLTIFRIGRSPSLPLGISLASSSGEIFYVPFMHDLREKSIEHQGEKYSERFILQELLTLLQSRELLGCQIKELLHQFITYTGTCPQKFFDVAIAFHLLEAQETSPKLSSIARKFLSREIEGREELLAAFPTNGPAGLPGDRIARTATSAAAAIHELTPMLKKRLADEGLEKIVTDLEHPLIPVLTLMERAGIFVDGGALREASEKLGARATELEEEIHEAAGEKFNINSPKQLGEILFGKLQLPAQKKTKQGYSTSQDVLQDLADRFPVVRDVLEYKEVRKLQSTYTDKLPDMIDPATGRIHSTFNTTVTATGRLSSTEPNLQNIPIRTSSGQIIRAAFKVERPENSLVEADYSQIELRVLAHLSRDARLIDAFQNDEDVHNMTAGEIFGLEPSSIDAGMRRKAKEINFGIIYGMSAHGLAQRTGVTRNEAKIYIDKYMERFSGVRAFIESTIAEAYERGFVTTLLGRKRWLPDLRSRNLNMRKAAERMAINTPVQGSAAELIKLAMIAIHAQRSGAFAGARMILQVHDELLFELPDSICQQVCGEIKKIMESVYPLIVPVKVNIRKGKNWALMTDVHFTSHEEVVGAS